jgi:hypothetical protein
MEDEKRLFYEKLDEYESKLPQKYVTSDSCPFLDLDIPIFQGNFNTVLRGIPGN